MMTGEMRTGGEDRCGVGGMPELEGGVWGGGGVVWDSKVCGPKMARPDFANNKFRFFPRWSLWSGEGGSARASNGQVATSSLGSGRACPTAVIAFCPSRQCTALSQYEACCQIWPLSLLPLSILALWALQGYACIQVRGHSLPVLLCLLAPLGQTRLGLDGYLGCEKPIGYRFG